MDHEATDERLSRVLAALIRNRGWAWKGERAKPGGRTCLRKLRKLIVTPVKERAHGTNLWTLIINLLGEHLGWESGDIEDVWITKGLLARIVERSGRISPMPRRRPNAKHPS